MLSYTSALRRRRLNVVGPSVLALLCLAGCTDVGGERDGGAKMQLGSGGFSEIDSRTPTALGDMEVRKRRLIALALSGTGDPDAEARRSLDRGDFRLIGYSFLVPGIFPAAYGVECRPSVFERPDLVGALFAANDVPENLEQERAWEESFRRFGSRYNAIVLADPRFPHRQQCSAVPVGDPRERPPEYRPPG